MAKGNPIMIQPGYQIVVRPGLKRSPNQGLIQAKLSTEWIAPRGFPLAGLVLSMFLYTQIHGRL